MNRWFFDPEFSEDGERHTFISIGIIDESGLRGYYAHSADYKLSDCNLWVKQHVLPKVAHIRRKPRAQIALDLVALVGNRPEFWSYYAATDWVVMYQMFGTLMDLPPAWPRHCMDLKQEMVRLGVTLEDIEAQVDMSDLIKHNAMDDAKRHWRMFMWLKEQFPNTWHGATVPMGDTW